MHMRTAKMIYFSPTHTTKKIMEAISHGIQADVVTHLDLTSVEARMQPMDEIDGELAVIGVPVYSGRVPKLAAESLQKLTARRVPTAIVVVYGNREYEDALLELRDLASDAGFTPIAAGVFIGEHSFATEAMPIAPNRPDTDDLDKAKSFGEMVLNKVAEIDSLDDLPQLQVPGNFPYKEHPNRPPMSPRTQKEICTLCGECAVVCPTEVIAIMEDSVETDPKGCILCCACVKGCPTGARVMEADPIRKITEWLHTNCSEPKMPEMYF